MNRRIASRISGEHLRAGDVKRGTPSRLILLSLGVLVLACRQSYTEGMRVICEAPKYCCDRDYPNPADKWYDLAAWIGARLKNREALAVSDHVANLPPDQKSRALLEAARKAGISDADCPTAFLDEHWKEYSPPR